MRLAPLGAALVSALLPATPALSQSRSFDGTWSVEIVTEQGGCDRAYRYTVVIENGRVRYGGSEAFNVTGQVARNGTITGGIARGSDRAEVTGRLAGMRGSGTWKASGGRTCSGNWNADKRS